MPVTSLSEDGSFWVVERIRRQRSCRLGAKTRKKLGWNPTGPGLIADLERMRYPEVPATVAS